ncbi:MAG: Fur family transcriptional regulator [Rhizobiaceae bacterium]
MAEQSQRNLTKNQSLVMDVLVNAKGPLSAYTILDELRVHGFRAPLQVYRAIEKLLELGLVHRLESLNAFVACSHPECETHQTIVFMICDQCRKVEEISDNTLARQLERISENSGFVPQASTVELKGHCEECT